MLAPMKKLKSRIKKALTLSLVVGASTHCTYALTEQSQLVKYLQEQYADQGQNYPILIMDQDEIELRYAKENAFGSDEAKEKLRSTILAQYVQEKTGVELNSNEASGLEPYTSVMKGGAYAIPTFESYTNKQYKICSVFPASVNSNQRLETHRILGLDTPGAYPAHSYHRLKKHIPFEILKMYSILHELGHCLDRTFMPSAYSNYEPNAHSVHESESFAETFSTFMLIKEGYENWAQTRALYRNLYTRYMGQWFVDNPQNGFGSPLYLKGGIIYYLTPSLLQANYVIERNRNLKDMSVLEYIEMAEVVVKENAVESRAFQGIYRTFSENTENVIDFYREFSLESPDFFKDAYEELLAFLDFSPYLETQIFGEVKEESNSDSVALIPISSNKAELVTVLNNYIEDPSEVNRLVLDELVDLYRSNLELASNIEYEKQQNQKEWLDKLWEFTLDN